MPCYSPVRAWVSKTINPTGKRSLVYNRKQALQPDCPVTRPCGNCIGCRLERARQWAVRSLNEASLYKYNSFITLTYDTPNLPENLSLDHSHFQLFMKSLRDKNHYIGSDGLNPIRAYMCGEYGSKNGRPHYHAALFNLQIPDLVFWQYSKKGHPLFKSQYLEKLWKRGSVIIGELTFESAAYIASYITEKITVSEKSPIDIQMRWAMKYVNWETGEILKEEYQEAPRRPGLGAGFFQKWQSDIYPQDLIISRGVKMRPPKYYDNLYKRENPYAFEILKEIREHSSRTSQNMVDNNLSDRLTARETVAIARHNLKKRNL